MKKRLPAVVALLALTAAAFAGWRWYADWRLVQTTDDAYVEGDITNLAPKVAGLVAAVEVGDNQAVKAGDVLVRIDPRDFAARVAEAEAVVAARQAALEQLDDRAAVQRAAMAQAGAGIAAARADVTRSRADLERTRQLASSDFASRQRLDAQAAEAAKAEAGLKGSSAQATQAERQLAVLESERAVAAAQLEQARAQLELARSDLDGATIRAPMDGVIGNRVARAGMYVRPGQHLLAVVPLAGLWVDANFKETQLAAMRPGQSALLEFDAFPGTVVEGRVASFSPASGAKFSLLPPENATGNFTKVVQRVPVRIGLPAGHPLDGRLAPGLSAVVRVRTGPIP
ncbi:HlyD family secretion protein [Magnetospirillum sp. UT-4]|uniref:HlyD family secretion protein n=1 Tax=Magnetospirillum sp. UT-4 TaxID=2681467 RepID=UPI00137EB74B|nr:HlyD family secretion protein [Magnetospirillum sp. UT-4]CAA7611792.1 putative Multidrug resistance efflux pump [Magnetospirillum sp. UT-4]